MIIKPGGVLINRDWYCSEGCAGQRGSDDERAGEEGGSGSSPRGREAGDEALEPDYTEETEININEEVDLSFGDLI